MGYEKPVYNYSKVEPTRDLKEAMTVACSKYGDKPFLTWKKGDGKESLSYKNFARTVEALGTGLYNEGLMGKHVAIISETRWEYLVSYFAVVNGGGVIIPLDKELQPEQVKGFIKMGQAEAVICSSSYKEMLKSFRDTDPVNFTCKLICMDNTMDEENFLSLAALIENGRALLDGGERAYADCSINNEVMCTLLFTSGTTGTSKGVMLSHLNIATNAYNAGIGTDFNEGDRLVSVLPIHHTYEMSAGLIATFMLGCEICINDSIKMISRNFKLFQPTGLALVPLFVETMYKKIWDEIGKKGKTKTVKAAMKVSNALLKIGVDIRRKLFAEILDSFGGRLVKIISGGAPLRPELVAGFRSFGIDLSQGYGITECSPLVAVCMRGYKCNPASAGYPVPQCEVKIDKSENEQTGEILVRGENVMLGYINNPEATAEVMTPDGFFRTGDIGYLDELGYLYITGRKKNVIVLTNGKNVFPEEIEEHLGNCELIKECAVVGRTQSDGNVVITALIFPDLEKLIDKDGNAMSKDEIHALFKKEITHINKTLPSFKHIADFEIRDVEFEKNTSKKIKRFLLK
ncbi:MAG: long-chain fatty acid--CoA ligase [Eubacteriales bacterium]